MENPWLKISHLWKFRTHTNIFVYSWLTSRTFLCILLWVLKPPHVHQFTCHRQSIDSISYSLSTETLVKLENSEWMHWSQDMRWEKSCTSTLSIHILLEKLCEEVPCFKHINRFITSINVLFVLMKDKEINGNWRRRN